METVVNDGKEFLAIKLAVTDRSGAEARVKFTNANGLLAAFKAGGITIGQQVMLSQFDVRITSIRTHYLKDGIICPLRHPEVALTRVRAIIGAAPRNKTIPTKDIVRHVPGDQPEAETNVPLAYTDQQQVEEQEQFCEEPVLL